MKRRRLTQYSLGLALACLIGCSHGDIPSIPVKGKILFAGAKPTAPVTVTFVPLETENQWPKIPGTAVIAEDGTYHAVTEQAGRGLIPGRYVVNIECWKQPPTMEAPTGVSYLPPDFRPAQELVVKSSDKQVEYDLQIPASP